MKIKSFVVGCFAVLMLGMSSVWADSIVNPIDQALERQGYLIKVDYKCKQGCDAMYSSCMAGCVGLNDKNRGVFNLGDKEKCEFRCYEAKNSCKSSC